MANNVIGKSPDSKIGLGLGNSQSSAPDPFAAAPIQAGMDMVVDVIVNAMKVKVKTSLIGFNKGQFLIIATPKINGTPVNYRENKEIVIRYLLEGSIFGFYSEPMRMVGPPFNITLIQYPEAIEEVSLRGAPRIQVVIPLKRESGNPKTDYILDLSMTGALLQLSGMFTMEEVIQVSFVLPNQVAIENLNCTCKRIEMDSEKSSVGVHFDNNHPDFHKIEEYINIVRSHLSDG